MLISQARRRRRLQTGPGKTTGIDFKHGVWSMFDHVYKLVLNVMNLRKRKKTLTWDCIEVYCWFGGICLICPNAFGF